MFSEGCQQDKQRKALIMTLVFPIRVPTSTRNSDAVSTRGEVVGEHTAACSEYRKVLVMLRFAKRDRRQASPAPCPKGAPTRLSPTKQPSARDSRHRVSVPGYSACSSRDPQSAMRSPHRSLHTRPLAGCPLHLQPRVAAKLVGLSHLDTNTTSFSLSFLYHGRLCKSTGG